MRGGFTAIRELAKEGIRANATLIMTVAQAWYAARAGAAFISPFLGWKDQFGDSPKTLIGDVRTLLDKHSYPSEIIAAAVRNSKQIGDSALAGAHRITSGASVYQESFRNPYTTLGEGIFQNAWNQTPEF